MTTLRDLWVQRGMTSTQLAGQANISVPTLYRMNRKEPVQVNNILAVCKILHITRADYDNLQACPQSDRYRP